MSGWSIFGTMDDKGYTEKLSEQLGFCIERETWGGIQDGSVITFFDQNGRSTATQSNSNTWPAALWDLTLKQAEIIDQKDKEIAELRGEGKKTKTKKVERNDQGELVVKDTGGKV